MKPKEVKGSPAPAAAQRQDGGCPTSEMQDQQQQQQQQLQHEQVSASAKTSASSATAAATPLSSVGPLHVPDQSPTSSSIDGIAAGRSADDVGCVGSAASTSANGIIGRTSSPLMATDTPERPSSSNRKQREKNSSGSGGRNQRQSYGGGGRHASSTTGSDGWPARLPPRSPPVPSNQQQRQRGEEEEEEDPRIPAAELSERLEEASLELVDNLFRFLGACRRDQEGGASAQSNSGIRRRNTTYIKGQQQKKRKMGLTLPASAIGWLSSRMDPQVGDEDANYHGRITRGSSRRRSRNNAHGSGGSGGRHRVNSSSGSGRRQSPSDSMQLSERLALLRFHLPQYVEHLRITNEEWPPPPAGDEQEGRRSSSGSPSLGSNRQAGHQNGRTSALNRLSSPRSKGGATPGTPITQSPGKRNVLAGYCISACAATLHNVEARGVDDDVQPSRSVEQILLSQYSQFPQKQAAMRFLLYWQRLQNHPRVDLALFTNVKSLILDGVLPEWIDNFGVIRDGLEVFRVERACIYNMASLLLPAEFSGVAASTHAAGTHCVSTPGGEGPSEWDKKSSIGSTRAKESVSSHVTNLDLHRFDSLDGNGRPVGKSENKPNCYYTSLSRLKLSHCAIGECYVSDKSGIVEPFSRMSNLESLSLSHNDIARASTACAGLRGLPQLSALDLSFNRIRSMNDAFLMLGNIRTLILSWNQLSTVAGLERMYSLERLAIDYNNIQYLQDAAGLANLPDLMHLEMKGNPIETNDSRFRVNLLNLFKERRLKLLPRGATYRQLQDILPVLDGKIVTPAELVGLKEMTFAPLIPPPLRVTDQSAVLVGDAEASDTRNDDVSGPPMTHADFAALGPQNGQRIRSSLPSAASPRKIRRQVQTRKANIRCSILLPQNAPSNHIDPARIVDIDKKKSAKPIQRHRLNGFSIEDIISALVPRPNSSDDIVGDKEEEAFVDAESSIDGEDGESTSSGSQGADVDSFMSATSHADETESEVTTKTYEPITISPPGGVPKTSDSDGMLPMTDESEPDGQKSIDNFPGSINSNTISFPDLLGETGLNKNESKHAEASAASVSSHRANEKADRDQEKDRRPFDFGLAEKKSVYDGKESYSKLSVRSYLQLYFQTFVFPTALLAKGSSFYEEGERQGALGERNVNFPRIQLFHSDRELAMRSPETASALSGPSAAAKSVPEKFIDIWTDEIMACGLAATSRLPPVSESLRGFHGEVIRNRGVDELSSESQEILLCLTDAALYFIPGFADDKNKDERRFPRSLPVNATFGDALWPHALARHPLEYLQRITIGFQFQRLVLHFVLPKRDGQTQGYEYAYVAFTCNKLQTISLVQKLQAQKKALAEQRADCGGFGVEGREQREELIIDNDDRVVLDSLADAVAPIPMGVVLHYQVLRQKWRSKRPDGTDPVVRRVCVVTDGNIFLLDEHYIGDGSTTTLTQSGKYGDPTLRLVDSAGLAQVTEIRPADEDPTHITLVIQKSRLVRSHRWRLVCKDGESAERLVHDVRQAVTTL